MLKYAIGALWDDDTAWSTTSGGANDTTKPTNADDCIADANTPATFTLAATGNCNSLEFDVPAGTPYAGNFVHNSGIVLNIGSAALAPNNKRLRFSAGMTYTRGSTTTSEINLASGTNTLQEVVLNGKTISRVNMAAFNSQPVIQFLDNLILSGGINQQGGHYNVSSILVQALSWAHGGGNARVITMTNAIIELLATSGTIWNIGGSPLTLNASGSEIKIASISSSDRTLSMAGKTYGKLTYIINGSTGKLIISSGSNTFSEINFTDNLNDRILQLVSGQTQTVTTLNVNGLNGKFMTIQSSTGGSPATISVASGTVTLDHVKLKDITFTGGATFIANNSIDLGGNTGITINAPPVAANRLSLLGVG